MILKSFQISSYRSCQKTKLFLSDKLTGLIGINGSGKTNILNAILLLRKLCETRNRYMYMNSKELSLYSCRINAKFEHDDVSIELKGKIKLETDERNGDEIVDSELKWKFSNYKHEEWFPIPIELFSTSKNQFHFPDLRRIKSSEKNRRKASKNNFNIMDVFSLFKDPKFKKNVLPLLNEIYVFISSIKYYSATQFSNPNRCPISIELEEYRPRRSIYSFGHEQFILDLYQSSKKTNDKDYKKYINTVGVDGIGLINNIDFKKLAIPSNKIQVQSGGRIKQINAESFLIVPIFTIKGRDLSPNQLSEGTLKTLALLYYVITDQSKLLLIEEPEVCVHHGLLNSIMKLIIDQSINKQILISTHSDYVLDLLTPENILLVKYLESKGTTAKQLEKTMSKNNYIALKNYLNDSGNLGEYWREGGIDSDSYHD